MVFLAPNIIFIGQLEKDIGRCLSIAQYLSPADQYIRYYVRGKPTNACYVVTTKLSSLVELYTVINAHIFYRFVLHQRATNYTKCKKLSVIHMIVATSFLNSITRGCSCQDQFNDAERLSCPTLYTGISSAGKNLQLIIQCYHEAVFFFMKINLKPTLMEGTR